VGAVATIPLSDFERIADVIGAPKVILLGETFHDEASSFRFKATFIEYLHEVHGYGVLLWEAGRYQCDVMARHLDDGTSDLRCLEIGMPTWCYAEVAPVLAQVRASRQSGRPMRLLGIDCQFGSGACDSVGRDIAAWCGELQIAVPETIGRAVRVAMSLMDVRADDAGFARRDAASLELRQLLARVRCAGPTEATAARARLLATLEDLIVHERLLRRVERRPGRPLRVWARETDRDHQTTRDVAMAHNLLATVGSPELRGERFVVWLANFHAARRIAGLDTGDSRYEGTVTMGDVLHRALGGDVFSIAVHERRPGHAGVPVAGDPTIEDTLSERGQLPAFVDLRAAQLAGHRSRMLDGAVHRGDWGRVFDAVVVQETAGPPTPLRPRAEAVGR
jgi:erythromycin esterase-like protein